MFVLDHFYSRVLGKKTPYYFRLYSLPRLVWKIVRKFLNVSVIPFIPFNALRVVLYRLVGFQIGQHVFIGMQCYLDDYYPEKLVIEDHVTIAYRVTVATHGPTQEVGAPVHLKSHSYIGVASLLLGGVTVGEHAVVAGGAVVTKDVPAQTLVAGVPAVVIKECKHFN